MRDDLARAIAAANEKPWPDMVTATQAIFAPFHDELPLHDVNLARDLAYGLDGRHRLDVFYNDVNDVGAHRPVLIFVHGGGFVGGDKARAGSPYFDNVGIWAVRNGFVGVTVTYRLAPGAVYPAGAEDIGAAVAWVRSNVDGYGGVRDALVLMGHSAGASHVAGFVARDPSAKASIAGAVLLSGVYNFGSFPTAPNISAYVGKSVPRPNELPGFAESGVPVLLGITEFDPPEFHEQAHDLLDALYTRDRKIPNVLYLPQHNHISEIAHLNAAGTDDEQLSLRLRAFIHSSTAESKAEPSTPAP